MPGQVDMINIALMILPGGVPHHGPGEIQPANANEKRTLLFSSCIEALSHDLDTDPLLLLLLLPPKTLKPQPLMWNQ